MTIAEWLRATNASFTAADIETARLDALVLLSDQLGRDKAWLLAYSDTELQGSDLEILSTKVAQRMKHTPLAYIRGHVEFYGREFLVNEHVLIPRPDSEAIIDVLKKTIPADSTATIVDIGTGSGVLAITAKLERPNTNVIGSDIDEHCLETARTNAADHNATMQFLHGDLAEPLRDIGTLDTPLILLCNLPYVPTDYPVNAAAAHEPELALYSGSDGLDHYRKLFLQLAASQTVATHIITESLLSQHTSLADLAAQHGYEEVLVDSLVQLFSPNKAS